MISSLYTDSSRLHLCVLPMSTLFLSRENNYMLTPTSPCSESWNMGLVPGTPIDTYRVRGRQEASSMIDASLQEGTCYAGAVTSVTAPSSTGATHLVFLR